MKNNFFNSKNFLFRKDSNPNSKIQSTNVNCADSTCFNSEPPRQRKTIENEIIPKTSNNFSQEYKSIQYDDEPTLDEDLLKEMAQAYALVLSKYGYSVRHDDSIKKQESINPASSNFACQNNFNRKPYGLKHKTEIAREDSSPTFSLPEQQIPQTGTFESNLDYLSQNLLTSPTIDYMNNQALILTYFQTSNNLLQQILTELKVITCLIECNRRRRLS